MNPLGLIVDALAVYRLTKLVIDDQITEPLREKVWKRYPPSTNIGYLVTCPWCVSIYVGGAVVAARLVAPRQWDRVAQGLAFSSITGLISSKV